MVSLASSASSIVLYRNEAALWRVDATLLDNGDLLIMSGGLDDEWHCTVPATHLPRLLAALTPDAHSAATDPAGTPLLQALALRFAGDRNPYEDMLHFLERHAIPMTTTAWLSGESDRTRVIRVRRRPSACPEPSELVENVRITWGGIGIAITYEPRCFGGIIAHLELRADNDARLPVTETGYRSHFIPCGKVEAWGGAVAYVTAWLCEAAKSQEWRDHEANAQQLRLL